MSAYQIPQRLQTFLVVAAITTAAAWAQTPQTQPASQIPAPTIRVTSHMVLVDVVVTDKQGKAIPGLHPEDFVVEENGKAQKISSLVSPAENASAATPRCPPEFIRTGRSIVLLLVAVRSQ